MAIFVYMAMKHMHKQEFVQKNKTLKLIWDFEIETDHLMSARRPDIIIINKKKEKKRKKTTCRIVDFAVSAHHRVNLKESEKNDKYLDLARELKKLWNMRVTIIIIVIGALSSATKLLTQRLEGLEVFGSLVWLNLGLNPNSPGPLANTLTIMLMSGPLV